MGIDVCEILLDELFVVLVGLSCSDLFFVGFSDGDVGYGKRSEMEGI